ncbi:MAG TPA: class I SAM-dependent methyltransferase [Acidobacteriaceae bacterium]|nr:class I SAM-dependent methyltransferase [Acidobacteriaceae bacterium]
MSVPTSLKQRPDYGIDAPKVLRNLFVFGGLAVLLIFVTPRTLHVGPVNIEWHYSLAWMGGFPLAGAFLMLFYVKVGKYWHRDTMLALHNWRGDEQVLDVGCGRGLLLAGAAKRLGAEGHATGIDIWSNEDMGGNSEAATLHNLKLEGATDRCTLVSEGAQAMRFGDASFDVIVSNLCLHNIYDLPTRRKALHEIVRVLKPGGLALISDYKLTGEYVAEFRAMGLSVERRWGNVVATFPPLRIVIARKAA